MLGISTPELFRGIGKAVARCQTYEGGLSAASQDSGEQSMSNATMGEAHGGYAFCGLASHLSLSLLPSPDDITSSSPFNYDSSSNGIKGKQQKHSLWDPNSSASSAELDVDYALRWAISQQGIPIEAGGFRGRTNKLVDGCYGWFSGGGMFTVLSALVELQKGQWWHQQEERFADQNGNGKDQDKEESGNSDDWESVEAGENLNSSPLLIVWLE
jgi:protein farnesyltransferase subunit beta